jgi:hypothetical protein
MNLAKLHHFSVILGLLFISSFFGDVLLLGQCPSFPAVVIA